MVDFRRDSHICDIMYHVTVCECMVRYLNITTYVANMYVQQIFIATCSYASKMLQIDIAN